MNLTRTDVWNEPGILIPQHDVIEDVELGIFDLVFSVSDLFEEHFGCWHVLLCC